MRCKERQQASAAESRRGHRRDLPLTSNVEPYAHSLIFQTSCMRFFAFRRDSNRPTEFGCKLALAIEWIRIRPRYLKHVAQLLPKSIVDCEAELEAALQFLGQLYVKNKDSIWVYGYQ
jgi:hypothetical protein